MIEKATVQLMIEIKIDANHFNQWPDHAVTKLCGRVAKVVDAATGKTEITGGESAEQS